MAGRRILTNAGRCDICGKTVDMKDGGDTLILYDFGLEDEIKQEYDLTDQDAADKVAGALERVAESGADRDLARVIRADGQIRAHESCYSDTAMTVLESD